MSDTKGRDVAIVGVGHTDHGALYADRDVHRDDHGLAAEALRNALEDSGLRKDELDGLICARVGYRRMADVIGLRNPNLVYALEGSGRMSGVAVGQAAAMIR